MQNKRAALLLAGLLLLVCAGCGNIFAREYSYAEPYAVNLGGVGGDATEISNYNMLKSALLNLISRHQESGSFRFGSYNGSVVDDLAAACLEVRTSNPMGAWAVETLTYDASRIVSYYTANIEIEYKRTAEEIAAIQNVLTLPELEAALRETLASFGETLVLRVYSAAVDEDDIAARVERLYFEDPVAVPAEPAVTVEGYPGEGQNRIFDLRLRYGADAETLEAMSLRLGDTVAALASEAAAAAGSRPELSLALAQRLDALTAAGEGGTAYAALVERGADAKGIALAYKALCDAAGIECLVVKGSLGGMGTEEHFWNMLALEGAWYHADVSRFGEDPEETFLRDDAGFWGAYIWDVDAYPACAGSLRYRDLVPEEERPARPPAPGRVEETEPPEETAPPEESEPPEETAAPPEVEPPAETTLPPVETTPPPEETAPPAGTEPPEPAEPAGEPEEPPEAEDAEEDGV